MEEKSAEIAKLKKQIDEMTTSLVESDAAIQKIEDRLKTETGNYKHQVNQAEERLIQLNSDLQLKAFLAEQHESNLKLQKQQNS